MSIESTVYSPKPAISLSQLIESARSADIELRAFDPDDSTFHPVRDPEAPLSDARYVVIGWPRRDAETTAMVEDAIGRADKPVIDRLGSAGRLGWFELSCGRFDYEDSWKDFPDEREEVEESYPPDELEQMRRAETRYFFRCGTRPAQNGSLLGEVAELIASLTDGFLDVP